MSKSSVRSGNQKYFDKQLRRATMTAAEKKAHRAALRNRISINVCNLHRQQGKESWRCVLQKGHAGKCSPIK